MQIHELPTSVLAVLLASIAIACGGTPSTVSQGTGGVAGVGGACGALAFDDNDPLQCSNSTEDSISSLAAGYDHLCIVTNTGGLRCAGSNTSGQLGYPRGDDVNISFPAHDVLTDVQAVATGTWNTCVLTKAGGVRCWGKNDAGQLGDGTTTDRPIIPTADTLTGVRSLAMGQSHTCALMTSGGVRCWGGATQLTPPAVDALVEAQSIAAGHAHTCALSTSGGVRCWGNNDYGQLGDGTHTAQLSPPGTDVITDVRSISVGDDHTCALTSAGGVRCWGNNDYGQLGDGTTSTRLTPPETDILVGVQHIVAGSKHTCALTTSGGVRCWGRVGPKTQTQLVPPGNDLMTGVRAIAASASHTCAAMTTGGVRCWGDNFLSGAAMRTRPMSRDILTGAQSIAVDGNYSCALMQTGGGRCWGDNQYGQLGDGMTTSRAIPPDNDVFTGAHTLALGGGQTCLVTTGGGLRCWGVTGVNTRTAEFSYTASPPADDELTGVAAIALGFDNRCALMTDSGVRCWGFNCGRGQLGDGTTLAHSSALDSGEVITGVQAIATSGEHVCALTATGGVRCWGNDAFGQLGDGTFAVSDAVGHFRLAPPDSDVLSGVQAIGVGNAHTCALTTAGGVRCWGDNSSGQLGDGTAQMRPQPPDRDVLTGVRSISVGDLHTCALTTTGGVRCWGSNISGQLGDGTTTDRVAPPDCDVLKDVAAIAAGSHHTCALLNTGGVRCWGAADHGQLGDGQRYDDGTPRRVKGSCKSELDQQDGIISPPGTAQSDCDRICSSFVCSEGGDCEYGCNTTMKGNFLGHGEACEQLGRDYMTCLSTLSCDQLSGPDNPCNWTTSGNLDACGVVMDQGAPASEASTRVTCEMFIGDSSKLTNPSEAVGETVCRNSASNCADGHTYSYDCTYMASGVTSCTCSTDDVVGNSFHFAGFACLGDIFINRACGHSVDWPPI
jgi:alpha-tubulin suppressor-like RCC1 family protein